MDVVAELEGTMDVGEHERDRASVAASLHLLPSQSRRQGVSCVKHGRGHTWVMLHDDSLVGERSS
jgi:hypothetical protein